jgi:hypothetical protein
MKVWKAKEVLTLASLRSSAVLGVCVTPGGIDDLSAA